MAYRKDANSRRKRIANNRGNCCQLCGYVGYLDLHHIVPVSQGGSDDDENLMLLCEHCHARAHGWNKRKWLDPKCAIWHGVN